MLNAPSIIMYFHFNLSGSAQMPTHKLYKRLHIFLFTYIMRKIWFQLFWLHLQFIAYFLLKLGYIILFMHFSKCPLSN